VSGCGATDSSRAGHKHGDGIPQARTVRHDGIQDTEFEHLYRTHLGHVLAYARRRTGSPEAAEEIAAETFMVAWRRRADLPHEPLPWLYGVARRVLSNRRRGRRRRQALIAALSEQALTTPGSLAAQATPFEPGDGPLTLALSRLAPDDREPLMLVAWEELNYREAAETLGISESAFARRLRRARKRLTHLLETSETGIVSRAHDQTEVHP
jgi:RNA polymerase sigma-70 factor (ECF subfamily)